MHNKIPPDEEDPVHDQETSKQANEGQIDSTNPDSAAGKKRRNSYPQTKQDLRSDHKLAAENSEAQSPHPNQTKETAANAAPLDSVPHKEPASDWKKQRPFSFLRSI